MKLEAYSQLLSARTTVSVKRGNGQVQSRSRNVFRTTDELEGSATCDANLLKRLEQLEKQLEQVAKGSRGARSSSSRKASSKNENGAVDATGPDNGENRTIALKCIRARTVMH